MDMVYQRYSCPFSFIDGMIQTNRFDEFVREFVKTINQEKEDKLDWEFWLHKVWEGTFKEFKDSIATNTQNQTMTKETIAETVNSSISILNNFTPQNEGGE